jgi:hypothetical protein
MLFFGIGGLDGHALHSAELARDLVDHIRLRVDHDADDADVLLSVRDSHSADNIFGIQMENIVDFIRAAGIFDNDADDCDPCVFRHIFPPFFILRLWKSYVFDKHSSTAGQTFLPCRSPARSRKRFSLETAIGSAK